MSKELEALENMKNGAGDWYRSYEMHEDYPVVKSALQRLETIENANPSEALEKLDKVNNYLNDVYDYKEIKEEIRKDIDTIKHELLKSQEQEKVLEILKEKCVDIYLLKSINTLEEYNKNIGLRGIELTQEEFDLLKRYCDEEK